jgi:hypothetical protein
MVDFMKEINYDRFFNYYITDHRLGKCIIIVDAVIFITTISIIITITQYNIYYMAVSIKNFRSYFDRCILVVHFTVHQNVQIWTPKLN